MPHATPATETEALPAFEAQADLIVDQVFGGEANAEKTTQLVRQFVASYEQHKDQQPLDAWLIAEFRNYPTLWENEGEIEATARDIIATIQTANAEKQALYAHLDRGKSRESWLATRIEKGAGIAGVTQVGDYAQQIDRALGEANDCFRDAVLTRTGDISQGQTLHGFIAEAEVANRFNLNAQASQSGVRAEVLASNGYNSPDLVLRNAQGVVIPNVQIKTYADTNGLLQNLRAHDYPKGTVLLVHEHQVARVQQEFPDLTVTSTLEADGVKVDMPSRRELAAMRQQTQQDRELRQYEWNDVNRINVAKSIGKQALIGATVAAGLQGIRILSRRVWNKVKGQDNPPASEDLKAFFTSSIKSGTHVGAQVAVSGAVVVAAKNGLLGAVLRGTPAGRITSAVYIGLENAKILYKLAKGELNGPEALDAMGNVSCSALGGLAGAGIGMAKGAAIGVVFGPIGAAVGGFVGGVVGGMAGSKIGEAIYAGGKIVLKTASAMIRALNEGIKSATMAIAKKLNPLHWFTA